MSEEELDVKIHSISQTGRSRDGVDILEVSVMIQVAEKQAKEFKADVYPQEVELKSDPDYANLHPDDLKDIMACAAADWDKQFSDWETTILSRDEPVQGGTT